MVAPYFWNRVRMTERWEISQTDGGAALVRCFRDDFQVYSFMMSGFITAAGVLGGKMHALHHLPVSIYNRSDVSREVIGRPVYYREIPATISDFDGERGMVRVRSDSASHKGFPPEPWEDQNAGSSQDIWEDLLSPKIHWHREESS